MVGRAFDSPIGWWEVIRRTAREVVDDDCPGLAAQLADYFFLSLFPAVLFLLAVASFFSLHNFTDDVATVLGPFVSPEVLQLILDQMRRLANAESGGLLTFGVAGAIWSSSSALVSIVSSVNRAYDVDEIRPWWKVRLISIGLTIGLAVLVLASISLILAGPTVATYLGRSVGLGVVFEWTWKIVQWPVALGMISLSFAIIYYVGPSKAQRWNWISPGSLLATIVWLLSSLAFKFYIANFTDYNASYGAVGAVIVLLLWFYVSGLAILIGAEMNAEIEHAREAKGPPSSQGIKGG